MGLGVAEGGERGWREEEEGGGSSCAGINVCMPN